MRPLICTSIRGQLAAATSHPGGGAGSGSEIVYDDRRAIDVGQCLPPGPLGPPPPPGPSLPEPPE
jgi:hypothetical protein